MFLAASSLSLPMTGVDPPRGFIRPTLKVNRMKSRKDLETRVSL
jgi:hypothetical protein